MRAARIHWRAVPADDIISPASVEEWDAWLSAHHADAAGVWLKLAKVGAEAHSISYAEALDVALCHGWIDATKRGLDATHWLQRFAPRGPRSRWSQINREKAEQLIARGAMKPAGLRQVELAKADGRWDAAYAGQRTMQVPDDLQRALDAEPRARDFFATLDSRNRYAILYRLHDARKPETRAKRLATFVAMLTEGRRIHP